MGLDQNAWITRDPFNDNSDVEQVKLEEFYWRKHSKLQEFMELLYESRGNKREDMNCVPVPLQKEELLLLLNCVSDVKLPKSPGGFFYGESYQDESAEQYREDDIKFCHTAIKAINDGFHVTYSCWY